MVIAPKLRKLGIFFQARHYWECCYTGKLRYHVIAGSLWVFAQILWADPREFYMHACSFLDYVCMGKLFNKGGLRKTVIISRAEHVLAAGWAFKKAKRDSDCEDRKFGGKLNSGKNALAQKWRKVRNWKIRKTLKPVVMYHLLVRTSDPRADPGHLYSSKWCSTDWLLRLGHFLFFLLCSIDCFLNESWVSFPSN